MARQSFQINIQGPSNPEEVSARYLAEFLTRLEDFLSAYVEGQGLELSSEGPALSLVDVKTGSEGLVFSILGSAVPAISAASIAILHGNYEGLPCKAHRELFQLSEHLRAQGWGASFEENLSLKIAPAKITPDRGVLPPPEPAKLKGTTTLLARCLRVGGATKPKAEIRLSQSGELLYVDVSESIAKALGRMLYEEVVLEGNATWDAETWKIIDFKINEVTDFTRTAPHKAMEELAKAAKGRWEGVDAVEYVRHIRGDGESEDE